MARYFHSADELAKLVQALSPADADQIGTKMKAIASRRYTWNEIGAAYFALLENSK
jgi:hypothetical protein